jgi:hypothetical protein
VKLSGKDLRFATYCLYGDGFMAEEEKKKKQGVAGKSGKIVGDVAKKGSDVVKGFGKGIVKGFKKKDQNKD